LFDPFGWEVEACPNGQLEVWEVGVFSIPFRGLFIGLLVYGDLISKSMQLVAKSFFHFTVGLFTEFDCFEEPLTDPSECDGIDIISNGIEGCDNCAG
jgi:hypothetical protein